MKIVIGDQYGEVIEKLDLSESEIEAKVESGEIRLCTAGCNLGAEPNDAPIYHKHPD